MSEYIDELSIIIRENVDYLLEREGISMCKLAQKAEVHRNVLYNSFYSGRLPHLRTIVKIAQVLDITIDYLVTKHDFKHTTTND